MTQDKQEPKNPYVAKEGKAYPYYDVWQEGADAMKPRLAALQQRVEELETALEADATDLWKIANGIKKEIESRDWILEGRGPYEWDDDEYRQESRYAFEAVLKLITEVREPAANRYHAVIQHQVKALASQESKGGTK